MNTFGRAVATGLALTVPTACAFDYYPQYNAPSTTVGPYDQQVPEIGDPVVVGNAQVVKKPQYIDGQDLFVDISKLPDLPNSISWPIMGSLVKIEMYWGDELWRGTGTVLESLKYNSAARSILTAGHVITEQVGTTPIMPTCQNLDVTFFGGDLGKVIARQSIYDNDGSRERFLAGELDDINSVKPPTVDMGELTVVNTPLSIPGGELEYSSAASRPGNVVYIIAPKNGSDFDNPVIIPAVIDGRKNDRIGLITGIGDTADDDLVAGMSGSPIVTAAGKIIGIAVESNDYHLETFNYSPRFYDDDLGDVITTGKLFVSGISGDAEEFYDNTVSYTDVDGSKTSIDYGTGYTHATGQLFTSALWSANQDQAANCSIQVPSQQPNK